MVAKLAPRDPRVAEWQEQLPAAVEKLKQPDDFMRGKLQPEAAGVLSFGFVRPLMRNSRNFDQLIERVAAGASVDEALRQTYGHNGAELAKRWLASLRRTNR
jgi:hypothetical protein